MKMNYFGTKNNKLNKLQINNLLKYNINFILLGFNYIYSTLKFIILFRLLLIL